jgi:hypothetical protein
MTLLQSYERLRRKYWLLECSNGVLFPLFLLSSTAVVLCVCFSCIWQCCCPRDFMHSQSQPCGSTHQSAWAQRRKAQHIDAHTVRGGRGAEHPCLLQFTPMCTMAHISRLLRALVILFVIPPVAIAHEDAFHWSTPGCTPGTHILATIFRIPRSSPRKITDRSIYNAFLCRRPASAPRYGMWSLRI